MNDYQLFYAPVNVCPPGLGSTSNKRRNFRRTSAVREKNWLVIRGEEVSNVKAYDFQGRFHNYKKRRINERRKKKKRRT